MSFKRLFGGGRRSGDAEEEGAPTEGGETPSQPAPSQLWTDSHCHVQSSPDLEGILERARAEGVRRMVFVGTDEASSREAAAVAATVSGHVAEGGAPGEGTAEDAAPAAAQAGKGTGIEAWSTVGLHPHDAKNGVGGVGRFLRELSAAGLSGSRVVAVGECGLDYHYDYSPRDAQRDAFAAQIAFAHQYGLALVVHTREAWDDTFSILDREGAPPRLVFHCFTGGPEEARACLERGGFLSFSGIVTFPTATEVREAATTCPLDRMLAETDAPFLTPVPYRGKPNEPSFVPIVGAQIAALKELESDEIAVATTTNAAVVFDLHG